MLKSIREAADYIRAAANPRAKTAIILGTGLNGFADHLEGTTVLPYSILPNFPVSTVQGHAGNLIFGRLDGVELMVMQGRFHYYEGYSMQQVTFPVRVMKELGIETLILSNASGGINPDFHIGDVMFLKDHINFFPEHPLRGKHDDYFGARFPNMGEVYDKELLKQAMDTACKHNIRYHSGVYIGVQGPSLETPAEYKMYRCLGADAVGMSTVPEAIVAHQAGIRCLGISVITNVFDPGMHCTDSHEDILKAGAKVETGLIAMVKDLINR